MSNTSQLIIAVDTLFNLQARDEERGAALRDFCRIMHSGNVGIEYGGTHAGGGWWHDIETGERLERNFGELMALAQSEVAEALEADRKNLNDDKLTHRNGFEVELADCLIRLGDTLAALDMDIIAMEVLSAHNQDLVSRPLKLTEQNVGWFLAYLNSKLSNAFRHFYLRSDDPEGKAATCLAIAVMVITQLNEIMDLDIPGAIIEKVEYNKNRADHKRENRLLDEGKKY